MLRRIVPLGLALVAAALAASEVPPPGSPAAAGRRAILLSIDGLMPAAYTRPDELGLRVPNLRRLARDGAFAAGVVGVFPTVTYPSHTTLVTGLRPRDHGILWNTYFDPLGRSNDAWLWYSRAVRAPSLVSAVRAASGTVGAVSWPVSVGLDADFLVPEIWRSGSTHESDLELLRALSTPGLVAAVEADRGRALGWPASDADRTDIALSILRRHRPTLLLLHLFELDKQEHTYGPGSAGARAALEASDAALGRILSALGEPGLGGETMIAVVSDHGFLEATKVVRPNALLAEHGLLTLDDKGRVTSFKAAFHSHGGSASLRVADPNDTATKIRVRELLAAKLADPASGLAAIIDRARLDSLGADPEAELAIEAAPGFAISRTPTGGWLGDSTDRGYHGYDPGRPEMRASLLLRAPGLARRGDLGVVPMTRIAPTVAAFLGVELDRRADEPIDLFAPAAR